MKTKKINSFLSTGITLGALLLATCAPISAALAESETVTVTIAKYIDGQIATAQSANSADFPMSATWDAQNVGAGTGQYALSAVGFNNVAAYEATTADMTAGANYSTNEITDGSVVAADCTTDAPFALVGYSTGDTLEAAAAGAVTTTVPSFTNMQQNKFVIVWNKSCADTTPATVKVTIAKYIDGALATADSANNASFQMNANWDAQNVGSGSGQYALSATGSNNDTAYEATTVAMNSGASYGTSEVMDGTTVGESCSNTSATPAYSLVGYSTGDTLAAAAAGTASLSIPNLTNITSDAFIIVWNKKCSATTTGGGTEGTIGGDVSGGIEPGALAVTSVTTVNSSATADGTFEHGWKYTFNITAPDAESHLSMKFGNWTNTANASTILAANNMRISSSQADNSGATVLITAPNTYTIPSLNMMTDLDSNMPGRQVQVTVEVAVPSTTLNGSYTTTYGVQTLP